MIHTDTGSIPARVEDLLGGSLARRASLIGFWGVVAYALAGPVILRLIAPMIMKHDNVYFLPAGFAIRNGLGFNNPWANPIGSGAFDWHGLVHPALIALLAPTNGWWGINAAVVIIAALGMGVYLWMLRATAAPPVLKALGALVIVASFMSFAGRPETTAGLILGLLMLVNWDRMVRPPETVRLVASAALLGLLGAAHPLALIIASFAYAGFRGTAAVRAGRTPLAYVVEMTATGALAALTLVAAVAAIYPYDALAYAEGMLNHATQTTERVGQGAFLTYFVATKHLPFLALTFAPLAFILAVAGQMHWPRAGLFFKAVLAAALLGFVAALYRYPISIPATYYNYAAFAPAIAVLFPALVAARMRSWAGLGATAAFAAFAGFCALAQGLWLYQTAAGLSVRDAQARAVAALVQAETAAGRRVAVDSPLIVALHDPALAAATTVLHFGKLTDGGKETPDPAVFDVVLRAQAEYDAPPPAIPGFVMETDAFLAGHGAFGFSNPEHLGYAVYRVAS